MSSDNREQRKRRRRILGAGLRSLGRSALHTVPGYDRAKSLQKTGLDWFETLGGLKGAAMKLGQIAAQYQDLLPPQLTEQLARLQRNAEPWAFERLRPVLEQSWSAAQWAEIAHIEESAMAAASIGQVHAVTLADGREAVVKIRYPGVADAVDADIDNLGRLLRLSRFLPIRGRDLDAILSELRERFIEETDYSRELANLKVLAALDLPRHRLPEPVESLCAEAVLVTTRVDSNPIDEAGPDLGPALIESILIQIFTAGALHADPHPGNFGHTDDNRIALYDFGCMKYLDAATRRHICELVAGALAEDWAGVHGAMFALGAVPEGSWEKDSAVYSEIYARHARAVFDPLRNQPVYVFDDDGLIESIRHEVGVSLKYWKYFKAAPDMVFVIRTLSGLYWILRRMGARVALMDELQRIAEGAYGPDDTTVDPVGTDTPQPNE